MTPPAASLHLRCHSILEFKDTRGYCQLIQVPRSNMYTVRKHTYPWVLLRCEWGAATECTARILFRGLLVQLWMNAAICSIASPKGAIPKHQACAECVSRSGGFGISLCSTRGHTDMHTQGSVLLEESAVTKKLWRNAKERQTEDCCNAAKQELGSHIWASVLSLRHAFPGLDLHSNQDELASPPKQQLHRP